MFDLVGIGNPVYDLIVTPTVKTDGRVLSGCSTNACLAAKRLGLKRVGMIGCIGRDFADRFSFDMRKYGIETRLNSTGESGGFSLIYDARGDRTLDVLGVANNIGANDVPQGYLESNFYIIGPILGEVDHALIEYVRASTKAKIFLDPQGLIRTIGQDRRIIHQCDHENFSKIAKLVDFIKPNEHESLTITGENDPVHALIRLREMSPAVPIVTLADRGSVLLNDDDVYRIPAFQTNAVDPTGAGDVYGGSFITEFGKTGDVVESALFASAAASIMVEQVGPNFSMSIDEVERRREEIRARLTRQRVPS